MHPYHHSLSSSKKFGGKPEDYLPIHSWFDESKRYYADTRHRVLRHHAEGIFACEDKFGVTMTNSDGDTIPVRYIGEQHVREDMGFIPSLQDWCACIVQQDWMHRTPQHADQKIQAQSMAGITTKRRVDNKIKVSL
jgi:hypothetical protein